MRPRARRITAGLSLVLAFALPIGSAEADSAGHRDNLATAVTETDGSHVSDFAWDVSRQRAGDVNQHNAAYAGARCTHCGATAIAFQIVLVSGTPSTLTPRNSAVAVNDQCTRCVAIAEARQFVRVVDAPVRFTGSGSAELADVRRNLRALAAEDLPVADLHAAVEQQEARVRDVLQNDVVLKSDGDTEADALKSRVLQGTDLG